jgi:hypothetical protein
LREAGLKVKYLEVENEVLKNKLRVKKSGKVKRGYG